MFKGSSGIFPAMQAIETTAQGTMLKQCAWARLQHKVAWSLRHKAKVILIRRVIDGLGNRENLNSWLIIPLTSRRILQFSICSTLNQSIISSHIAACMGYSFNKQDFCLLVHEVGWSSGAQGMAPNPALRTFGPGPRPCPKKPKVSNSIFVAQIIKFLCSPLA